VSAHASAIASGALHKLQELRLSSNQIGDAGMSALAGACARGSLAKLGYLGLGSNKIGDDGMKALAAAVAGGALNTLRCHVLIGNPGSYAPVTAVFFARKLKAHDEMQHEGA
jgi:hypothetical protein